MTAIDLYVETAGPRDAPLVLLTGSLGSTLDMWDRQLPALVERFRVVRIDHRGHGRSPVPPGPYSIDDLADDMAAALTRVDAGPAHLVGLSLGGMTAMRLAARTPELVRSLSVLCSSAHLSHDVYAERAVLVRERGTEAIAEAVVSRWFTDALRRRDPELVRRMEAMVAATPREGYAGCCEAIATMDLREDLAAIRAPLLAVAGEEDPATPPEHLALIAESVAQSRLVVVPGAAHLANVEQPGAVNAALLEHLDST